MSRIFTWLGIGLLTVLGKLPYPFVARFGEALGRQGRHAEAAEALRLAFERMESVLGAKHPDSLRCGRARALEELRAGSRNADQNKSEALLRASWEAMVEKLGKSHPDSVLCAQDLAAFLRSKGKTADAAEVERAMA